MALCTPQLWTWSLWVCPLQRRRRHFLFAAGWSRCWQATHCPNPNLLTSCGLCITRCAWRYTSSTSECRPRTFGFAYLVGLDLTPKGRSQNIWVDRLLRSAEYLTAISAMVFPPVKRMKLFIALETSGSSVVLYPFLFGAERSLDDFLHLFVHLQQRIIKIMWISFVRYSGRLFDGPPLKACPWFCMEQIRL